MSDLDTRIECEVFVDYLISVIYSKVPRFMPVPNVPDHERTALAWRLASIVDNAIERKKVID